MSAGPEVTWSAGPVSLTAASGSVVGYRYDANYDVVHVAADRALAVVADGMGSGPGSAAAGRTAVSTFVAAAAPGPAALLSAVADVQREVRAAGQGIGGLTGCTLTAFVGDGDRAWLVQLGDSRVYRLRNGLLELLTSDHTMAWLGVTHGWLTLDSEAGHRAGYHLTRYAGHPDAPEPDILAVSLRPRDRLLLCTDGVHGQLSYDHLQSALAADRPPPSTVSRLLADTLQTGDDNATAVLIDVGAFTRPVGG
ncbi:protein phosphatase 2C domain-containing protein [Actinoplanes sp. NPDC051470]|uniref:PP2C family protein-serine/threonine phosphatase n=1 Tax=unclassified Actinoplanes TaxID=2626549 RepID=UPI003438ECCD